jgi:cold shock protein
VKGASFASRNSLAVQRLSAYRYWIDSLRVLGTLPTLERAPDLLSELPIDRRSAVQFRATAPLAMGSETMAIGTVKWFNSMKGYGFIAPESGGKDVFVHISAVERSGIGNLRDGQKVNFDVETDPRSGRYSAANLRAV